MLRLSHLPAESLSLVDWRCVVVGGVVLLRFCRDEKWRKKINFHREISEENEAEIANLAQIVRENSI